MAHKYGCNYSGLQAIKEMCPGNTDNLQLAPVLPSWQQPHARFLMVLPPFPTVISALNMVFIIHVAILHMYASWNNIWLFCMFLSFT